jgi:hypothetical protein
MNVMGVFAGNVTGNLIRSRRRREQAALDAAEKTPASPHAVREWGSTVALRESAERAAREEAHQERPKPSLSSLAETGTPWDIPALAKQIENDLSPARAPAPAVEESWGYDPGY